MRPPRVGTEERPMFGLRRRDPTAHEGPEHCYRHLASPGEDRCRRCRQGICGYCVVRVPRLGTYCVDCALSAAGVRMRSRAA
jgi:hypothetical protein